MHPLRNKILERVVGHFPLGTRQAVRQTATINLVTLRSESFASIGGLPTYTNGHNGGQGEVL